MRSTLAYTTNQELKLRQCYLGIVDNCVALTWQGDHHHVLGAHTGPLKWYSFVSLRVFIAVSYTTVLIIDGWQVPDKAQHLVSFTKDGVVCVDASMCIDSMEPTVILQERDHHWDQIGGVAFTTNNRGESNVHVASHAMIEGNHGDQFPWPLRGQRHNERSAWSISLSQQQATYKAEHKLSGRALTKFWGMSQSSHRDLVATCSTQLPNDMLMYAMTADQTSHLVITREIGSLPSLAAMHDQNSCQQGRHNAASLVLKSDYETQISV